MLKSKKTAILLAVLFGSFGAHQFYIGNHRKGLIILLITVCTCGIAYPFCWVYALIDAMKWSKIEDDETFNIEIVVDEEEM